MDGHFKKIIKGPGNRRMQIEYVPLLNLSWLLKMMKQLGRVDIIQRKSRTSVEHIPPSSLPFLFAVNESPLCPSRCHCLVSLCRHKENHILHSQFLAQPVVPLHNLFRPSAPCCTFRCSANVFLRKTEKIL